MATRKEHAVAGPTLDISNVIAAFSEEQVGKITGLTKGRLRYWAKTNFFKPSFSEDDPRLPYSRFYSFKDIVALRTLEILRIQNNVPLQHLRKVAENLSHLENELWTSTTLYVINRRVVFQNSATGTHEDVVSGQYLIGIHLDQIIRDTEKDIIKIRTRNTSSIGKVRKHRSIVRNAWAIAGTRIAVSAIKRLHEDGYSPAEIIEEYPDLTQEDIEAAICHDESRAA